MKTKFAFATGCLVMIAAYAFATIRTVSNDANRPAQFTDVGSAIAASSAGDTIYVNGTQYTYPDFTINKKVILIGAGYNSGNQFNLNTVVGTISTFRDSGGQDASGSVICGFHVTSAIILGYSSLSISNIRVFRNWIANFYGQYNVNSNVTIYNNIISNQVTGSSGSTNYIIQNNIFTRDANVNNFNQSSVVIDHNLFIHGNAFANLQFATITNNIIVSADNTQVMNGSVINCTFNSNLSLSQNISPSSSGAGATFLAQSNTGGGNVVGSDPLFMQAATVDFNNFYFNYNYRLQASSPGHNLGTDNSDIGIYGGSYPFPTGGAAGSGFDTSPAPPIPQITGMNVQNASVLPGGQLKVSIQATVNN